MNTLPRFYCYYVHRVDEDALQCRTEQGMQNRTFRPLGLREMRFATHRRKRKNDSFSNTLEQKCLFITEDWTGHRDRGCFLKLAKINERQQSTFSLIHRYPPFGPALGHIAKCGKSRSKQCTMQKLPGTDVSYFGLECRNKTSQETNT